MEPTTYTDQIRPIIDELFDRLQIDGSYELIEGEEGIELLLDTKDTGIVIGYHGEVLEALQLVLSLMVAKKLGEFKRVSVDVGDYKKNRTEYLTKLAQQVKERVLEDNREQAISSLKSWERRVIHMLLQDDSEVVSESVGEGKDRVLLVKPRE